MILGRGKLDINWTNRTPIFSRGTRQTRHKPDKMVQIDSTGKGTKLGYMGHAVIFKRATKRQKGSYTGQRDHKMDNLVQSIAELAKGRQRLTRVALRKYSVEVETIVKAQIRDAKRTDIRYDLYLKLFRYVCAFIKQDVGKVLDTFHSGQIR